jgi:hypothetical protein
VRFQERLTNDIANGYNRLPGWPADITPAMQRFVNDPIRFWLDETGFLYTLGDRLVDLYERVIKRTKVDQHTKFEAGHYKIHARSIKRVIDNFRKCDAGILP